MAQRTQDRQTEIERLRARVAELERELVAQAERTERDRRRGAASERTGSTAGTLDLDALMRARRRGRALDVAFRASAASCVRALADASGAGSAGS